MKYGICLCLSLILICRAQVCAEETLGLKPHDHVAIIGNALPDRMQHSGWLETLLYKRFPNEELVVRNLAVSGDEVVTRHRSENFGTPDEWLKKVQADVILAFFGFNESFKGYDGIGKFKADLDKFLKETLKQNYSGKGAPRLVLFSPIAQEKHSDPNLPDPAANNTNLKNYSDAMAEVAKANSVPFVDLFTPSQQLYAQAKEKPLTINSIHLTEAGDKALAAVISKALFGGAAPGLDTPAVQKLRQAIIDKSAMWHSRYRTMDGYNVYGGRSQLKFNDITNYKVMQEEMSVRDAMTANRDKRIWSVAKGGDLKVDDSNAPPVTKVPTNKPGANPDGTHKFLGGEEAIARMKVPPGCKVNLFASEKEFPELANPVQMAWDTKGRLWVAAWPNYPERTPWSKKGDSLLVFEDTNSDGKADKCVTFIEDLNCPTGFQFYKDGVLLMQAPDLWFVRDTDGDGKADWKERILMGMDSADSHHTTNAMCLEPGGAVYLSDGVFHRTQVETATGPVRNEDAAIYRFEPRTSKFERYIPYGFANPHGRVFDYWGNDLVTDATGNNTYFGPAFSGYIDYPAKHAKMKQFWERPSRPCPGTNILTSRHFPDEFQGNFLNCNVIGFQGIFRAKVSDDGSGLKGETIEQHLVQSDDPNFRPSAVSVAPDGSVYFLDWHNAIIGHMQHHIRDPNRGHEHGRIYRITYEGRPLLKIAKVAGEPIEKLLELLKEPENDVRERARIELGARDTQQVIGAAQKWAATLDKNDPSFQHHLTEALWLHQAHNVVDVNLLKQQLRSPEANARAAATRVLCYWRDRVPDTLALLKAQAADEHPRVRLQAVRAASFFKGADIPSAIEIVYDTVTNETDYYIEYCALETLKQLQPSTKEMTLPKNPKALGWVIDHMDKKTLAQAPKVEPILMAWVERPGFDANVRADAITELAKLHKTDPVTETVAALQRLDAKGGEIAPVVDDLVKVLTVASAADLAKGRAPLTALAEKAAQPSVRRAAWAALTTADAKPATTWAAAKTDDARQTVLDSIALVLDPELRAQFQPMLQSVLAAPNTAASVRTAALRALPLMSADRASDSFKILAAGLRDGANRTVAARAITQLPRESWSKDQAGPAAESILAWAKTVPADKRSAQDYVETVQVGTELASLLPTADAVRIRKELRGLGVSVFVVKTVREQMRYDTTLLVVEAGKPFEIIFENIDFMPHNLVVVKPGSRQHVATEAETMPPERLDRQGRAYVPEFNINVLGATKMAEANQKETLKLTAPKEPGDYEYVCTFPGHWMLMWGRLVVVKDVDAYLQSNPQAAPPAAPTAAARHEHHAVK